VPDSLSVAIVDETLASNVVVRLQDVVDLLDVIVRAQEQSFELLDEAVAVRVGVVGSAALVALLAAVDLCQQWLVILS